MTRKLRSGGPRCPKSGAVAPEALPVLRNQLSHVSFLFLCNSWAWRHYTQAHRSIRYEEEVQMDYVSTRVW